jgi:hypothetical protein
VLLEKKKLTLEGSVKKNLIQLVLAFDSSFYKGKKTLHNDPLCCFSCLFLDWIELILCECGFLMLGWFECMNLYWLYIYWGNKCLGLSLIRLICKKKKKKKRREKKMEGDIEWFPPWICYWSLIMLWVYMILLCWLVKFYTLMLSYYYVWLWNS